ncbi:MAG: hypothetical protein K2Q19_00425 [Rhodocyclaceae bacterium]|nr:hypothetical protein [Rhodocyclaceae bacterium]
MNVVLCSEPMTVQAELVEAVKTVMRAQSEPFENLALQGFDKLSPNGFLLPGD